MSINYSPEHCFHEKLKYLSNWREVVAKLDRVIVAGRSISRKEFIQMMEAEQ